ncbi:MAG: protein kinase, partial [Deltaproteobacteria bacterium]|nr:protein kinase [Deltaproteobacteria bacterium]
SLADLTATGPVPLSDAFEYTRQILIGLDHAHRKGLIHRDIKLENVVRCNLDTEDILIKILDFGMAKSPVREPENIKITKRGVALGTPQYMAPEQLRNQPVDERSDLYAVGVTLFRLITGTIVFAGDTMMDVFATKLTKPAPTLAEMSGKPQPEVLEQFIEKALHRKPAERFADAAEMLTALERVKTELLGPSEADTMPPAVSDTRPQESFLRALFDHPIEDLVYWYTCGRNPKQAGFGRRVRTLFTDRTGKLVLARFLITSAFVLGAAGAVVMYTMNLLPTHLIEKVSAPVVALIDSLSEKAPSQTAVQDTAALSATPAADTTPPADDAPSTADPVPPPAPLVTNTASETVPGDALTDTDNTALLEAKMLIEKKLCYKAEKQLSDLIVETSANPADAYYLLGRSQMCLKKWRDSLKSYTHAIEVDARYRNDRAMHDELEKLLSYPKARDATFDFIDDQLGKTALPMLVQLAGHEQNKVIRHQARDMVEEMGALSHVNMEASLDWDLHQTGNCNEKREIIKQLEALKSSRAKQVLIRAKDKQVRDGVFKKRYQHECVRKDIFDALARMKAETGDSTR